MLRDARGHGKTNLRKLRSRVSNKLDVRRNLAERTSLMKNWNKKITLQ